ncbi:MAG: hypothetical protein A4E32_01577 [Methanomassiliicoccales archaeon PtaU1.Bin124]|nr:MAG: hypothetical protein A4E32_01577 [Methanomassiliicoccales archaeon PtaU1.Bin124]
MFTGSGYDERFVDNMYDILDRMEERGNVINIVTGCDDVCSACPHMIDGVCEWKGSVAGKDASVLRFLGLEEWSVLSTREMNLLLDERLAGLEDIRSVCGECDWSGLCSAKLAEKEGRM